MERISDVTFKALASEGCGPALKMLNPGVDFFLLVPVFPERDLMSPMCELWSRGWI